MNVQAHTTRYISTYHMMTEDYRGCTRGQVCRDSAHTNDENPEGCLPQSSNNTQICKAFGQEGPSRFFCLTRTRDNLRPRECRGHLMLETYFQKLMDKQLHPTEQLLAQWVMTFSHALTLYCSCKNKRQFLLTLQ